MRTNSKNFFKVDESSISSHSIWRLSSLQINSGAFTAPGVKHKTTIVGGAGFGLLQDTTCELKEMYLAPHARGLGIGKQLLATVENKAKKAGYTQCYVETHDAFHRANSLYKKAGFKLLDKQLVLCDNYLCR